MKSETITQMEEMLKKAEYTIDYSYLTVKEARKIIDVGYKLIMKVEEITKSRENWRNKYEKRNNEK